MDNEKVYQMEFGTAWQVKLIPAPTGIFSGMPRR